MSWDVVALTQELVRIPSVNPMGREVDGPPYFEDRLTDHLQQLIEQLQLPVERHIVMPKRDNLITRLEGIGKSRESILLLEVHQDTVPVDGMTIPPFEAALANGRILGRGACDVKGGMATLLTTLARLQETAHDDRPTIVAAFTINEENGFDGIRHLCETTNRGKSHLLPRLPDAAIVTEPTELDVVMAHKGTVRWRCHTDGVAGHSSQPDKGINAIYRMSEIVRAFRDYATRGLPTDQQDPWVGGPTLSVGTIHGGISINTIPDRCTIEIDRRTLPNESPPSAYQHALEFLSKHASAEGVTHDAPLLQAPGLSTECNQALAASLSESCHRLDAPGKFTGVSYGTDAGPLSTFGVPTVVFGPGSIAQAHTKDEWIDTDSLETAVTILVDFCRRGSKAWAPEP